MLKPATHARIQGSLSDKQERSCFLRSLETSVVNTDWCQLAVQSL